MESILRGLYNGRIIPWERRNSNNSIQLELLQRMEEEEQYFLDKLPPDDSKRFRALSGLYMRFSEVGEEALFSYAFTLGAMTMLDMEKEAEGLFNG